MAYTYEETNRGATGMDLYSVLLKNRIILLNGEINERLAAEINMQLLALEAADPDADITIYINSPGGNVQSGMSIYDTMQQIRPQVSTICTGMAASMAAFLLMGGQKGKRYAQPNAEVMIHQPLGAATGQTTDVQIMAARMQRTKEKMLKMMAEMTGQPLEKLSADCERDYFMTAQEALDYHAVDEILAPCDK